jgi:phosphonate transport system substrate-binding protein
MVRLAVTRRASHGATPFALYREPLIPRFAPPIVALIAAAILFSGISSAWGAEWRRDIGTFRIGMLVSSAPTSAGLDALRKSYAAALGVPVEFFIARDFAMLVDAQATSRVDYAIYSAIAYATAAELCRCVEPIAAPTDVDGAFGIRSILLAHKGKLATLADLPKARLVMPAKDDVSGWLAPRGLLAQSGLTLRGDESFIATAATVIEAEAIFARSDADALLGWERVALNGEALLQGSSIDRLRRAGVDVGSLDRVWTSAIIPFGPHVVLNSLEPEAKTILSNYLTSLHSADPQAYDLLSGGHAGGFVAVDESHYGPVRDIVSAIKASEP